MLKMATLYTMASLYVIAGSLHFVKPKLYLSIMPKYLPAPKFLIYLSGAIEIGLGCFLLFPGTRTLAAWGVIALLIAVFPANIYMLQRGGKAYHLPNWLLWVRLPLQGLLMAWAWIYT